MLSWKNCMKSRVSETVRALPIRMAQPQVRTRGRMLGVLATLALTSLSACAAPRAKHVFIVSFDGGKPSVMLDSKMPTFFGMALKGAHTFEAQTIFPSLTLVSHTSMLTGVGPAKHKILWNDWQEDKGLVTVPTVFDLAKRKGYVTAAFPGKEKFKHLNVPGTLDRFHIPGYQSKLVAAEAAKYIEEAKPNLCFIHFADGDGAGHSFGWGTPEQKAAFADTDDALAVVRDAIVKAGIENDSVIIMSADHGGHDRTHGTNSPEDMTIPWVTWGAGVKKDFRITAPVTTYDSAATALWLLDVPIPAEFDGKPVVSAYTE
jgi:predicted AlkP superfamily pyrophosphatase or phosphodiesterase